MIHSTSTNFGTQTISLKCHNSPELIVLQGKFNINPANPDYQTASQLEIVFDAPFAFAESESSSCYLLAPGDNAYTGTILSAKTENNKLIIEKLPIFSDKSEITIVLCSAFIPKDSADTHTILQPATHTPITYRTQDYRVNFHLSQGFNHFAEEWGFISALFDSAAYHRGQDTVLTLQGFPADVELYMPIFCPQFTSYYEIGTQAVIAHIENSSLTIPALPNSGIAYLGDTFLQGFFVRE